MLPIRELVTSLRSRQGVTAAVVVGRDGLVIDGDAGDGVDRDRLAAHLPALLAAGDDVGHAASRGALATMVLEHERGGLATVSVLTPDVRLVVLLAADAPAGPLVAELRRERARFASLVRSPATT